MKVIIAGTEYLYLEDIREDENIRNIKNNDDLDIIMDIWLESNIETHSYINENYWRGNFEYVKKALPESDLYLYEYNNEILGFIGILDGYIAGIFIRDKNRSMGIGKKLLDHVKKKYYRLSLNVFKKNEKAVKFYLKNNFIISEEKYNEELAQYEYHMTNNR